MYKGPIIEILQSSTSKEASQIADTVYEYFCYNTKDLFRQTSLGIPVYYYSEKTTTRYCKNEKFILLLIDDVLMLDCFLQEKCLNLIKKNGSNITIIPVLISDAGFNLVKKINSIPLYLIADYSVRINVLLYEITRIILQKLKGNAEKIKIFISYCRQDGQEIVQHLCNYIHTKTHLSTILDATSIEISSDFQKEIEDLLSDSSILFICTDKYSSSFWCLEEVLLSKKHDIPSIIVDAITEREDRRFPYLGNTSVIKWEHSERIILDIINKLLFMTLKQKLIKDYNNIACKKNYVCFSHYPELANFTFINHNTKLIFYPDPPLGSSEIRFLENHSKRNLYTPITYQSKLNNKRLRVCISLSKAADLTEVDCFDGQINYIYLEILRYLIYSKHIVAYGGDWRKDGYTEYIYNLIRAYQENQELLEYRFQNYLAFPFYLNLDIHEEAIINNVTNLIKVNPSHNVNSTLALQEDDISFTAYSLTNMRNIMINNVDAVIAISGKNESGHSILPGVLEEIIIAMKLKKPIFILGGFGGITKKVAKYIKDKQFLEVKINAPILESYKKYDSSWTESEYFNAFDNVTYSSLNNGLTKAENNILFESSDPNTLIPIILKGLSNL